MLIASRTIKIGDSLYHRGIDAWGKIVGFDPSGSAQFEISGPKGKRRFLVQSGGVIFGRRQLFWHEPIQLDLPFSDVKALQRVINAVVKELSPEEEK